MRRLSAAIAAFGTAFALTLVAVAPAEATLTAPGNGQVIQGSFSMTSTGASDGTACLGGSSPQVKFSLINGGGTTVWSQTIGGTGGKTSEQIVSQSYPNGTYTARVEERNRSGFLYCTSSTKTYNNTVTINNVVDLTFEPGIPGSAPQNTTVAVSAKLVDPNLAAQALSGRTVTFSLSGGGSVNATTNSSGIATANLLISGPPRPNAQITASFAATSFYGSDSTSRSIEVTKNDTSTTLAQPATVVFGEATNFTATVTAENGTGAPTGTVQFKVDGADFGAPVPLSGGTATSGSTSSLSAGAHTVTAVYSGDSNFETSAAGAVTQQVDKAATTTALVGAPQPTVSGQAVTFTATVDIVAPGAGTLAGGVQFTIDGDPYGTAIPLSGNTAQLTVSNLSTGNHDVVATYNGNASFAASSSAALPHGVNKADSHVDLATSDASAVSGQDLTYTATVTAVGPGSGTPTGTVQFSVDGDPLGGPVTLVGGVATSPVANLGVPSHLITAAYSGDANFGGESASLTQLVAAANTTTTVTSSPNPSVFGQPVQVRADVVPVAPATGNPLGLVQFFLDGNPTGVIVPVVNGSAEATLTGLSTGGHTISARYFSGDVNFVTSTSAPIDHTVNKASTTVDLTSDSPVSVFGQPVTFTATVAAVAPGAGSPSGTIVFKDGATVIGTEPVSSATGGQASITVSNLTVAQHAISASYSGDGDFNPSNGSAIQKVNRALTSVVVASSANPAQNGQSVQFTATVSPVAPGAGDPSGTVKFTVNGVQIGGPVTLVNGVATSNSFASLTPGRYAISAAYSGDGNFVASSGVLDQGTGQGVSQGATSLSVVASPAASAFGQAVTFTTTVSAVAPATGKPTGVVQIWEGDELLGATSLATQGTPANTSRATFVTSTLTPGDHAIRAVYVGNYNFSGQTGTTNHTVGQVATVTGIASSKNPSTFGDAVTFTATVATTPAGVGTPTGTVTFTNGAVVLGTVALADVQGQQQASITLSGLEGGTHAIKAAYSGAPSMAPSVSPVLNQQVNQAASTLVAQVIYPAVGAPNAGRVRATLTGNGGAPLAGQPLRFTTTQPTDGSVIFICDVVTDANGFAECDATSELTAINLNGGYDVNFNGNQNYLPSTDHSTQFNAQD